MTIELHALVLEDEPVWCDMLKNSLERIDGMRAFVTKDVEAALARAASENYAIVTVDISLVGNVDAAGRLDDNGLQFLNRLRKQQRGLSTAVFLISGHATPQTVGDVYEAYRIDGFIDKSGFDNLQFTEIARRAILRARLRAAEARAESQHHLRVIFGGNRIQRVDLSGPIRNGAIDVIGPAFIDSVSFGAKSDHLNALLLAGEVEKWRELTRSIGLSLYERVTKNATVVEQLLRARDVSHRAAPTVLSFSSSAPGLRIPFELIRDENDYLCLNFVMTRQLTGTGIAPTRKGESFSAFVRGLIQRGEYLRILLVGVDSDGNIPESEKELGDLAADLHSMLRSLGIPSIITTIGGAEATFEKVAERLRSTEYHLFHYAGHGSHRSKAPERSGVTLGTGKKQRILTAADFKLLLGDTAVRAVYLNCCVGAMTAPDARGGDFLGTIDAIVRADVPFAIGHRWVIPDDEARPFARDFYRELFTTFSPGMALLAARMRATSNLAGRNNPMWASPVLVNQSPA